MAPAAIQELFVDVDEQPWLRGMAPGKLYQGLRIKPNGKAALDHSSHHDVS